VPCRLRGPMGGVYFDPKEYHYQAVRCNVDTLKVIQIGLTLMDARGRTPATAPTGINGRMVGVSTWQFNFRFDLQRDMYANDSMQLLIQSGLNFGRMPADGIDGQDFAELLMSSGLVLNPNIRWISFDGCYDFGYALKLLTDACLPPTLREFTELLAIYFPIIYDIKLMIDCFRGYTGSLEDEARQLDVKRYGQPHQAGSDSLLTGCVFFKMSEAVPPDAHHLDRYVGHLFRISHYYNDSKPNHCNDT